MEIFSMLLIALAANLDNLGVGVVYGLRETKIPLKSNMIIAMIGSVITFMSVTIGGWIGTSLSPTIASIGGGIVLFGLGAWTVYSDIRRMMTERKKQQSKNYFQQLLDYPERADADHNNVISSQESILLGFALSLNCFGVGIGGGITGVSALGTAIMVGFTSFLIMIIGIQMGKRFSFTWTNSLAGLLLLGIGLYEIFF
jgi:putative sporulation protein YtaF